MGEEHLSKNMEPPEWLNPDSVHHSRLGEEHLEVTKQMDSFSFRVAVCV
jgi:hypothetical protein